MTLRHSVQHAVEGLADRITRVRYEIPPDCTFRAVVTGAADLVSISNIAAQTDGDETFFPLPSGSGSFEIDIMSSGTDTNGLIKLVMGVGGDVEYCFDSQAFETISSILEKKERFTMNGDEERTPFRLHPALNGFTADWELLSQGGDYPQFFPAGTGGTAANAITDASEVWASAGMNPGTFPVHVALRGYHNREDGALQVFSMVFEPITSETNALGKTVNPSCVVVRRSGYFKATVSNNLDDDEIVWNASSEETGLVTSTGRMAEVRPTACGTYTLNIQVGDYERVKGEVKFIAVEETTTEIRAYILGTTNGFPRTAAEVTNYVAEVNRIYEQVGMKFTLCSVTNLVFDARQLHIGASSALTASNICNIATNTGGVEVYFVPDTGTYNVPAYVFRNDSGEALGIIAGPAAEGEVLAHEIGHSCGLRDIYVNNEALRSLLNSEELPDLPDLTERVPARENLPGDWGSTSPDMSFYSDGKRHETIINNLLMMGVQSDRLGTDIPFGAIFGNWYIWNNNQTNFYTSLAPVGVTTGFERNPRHE